MKIQHLIVGCIGLSLLAGAGAWTMRVPAKPSLHAQATVGDGEEVIALEKAPEGVRAAAIKMAGDAKNITKVIREEDEGIVTFEVEYTKGAGADALACAAVFSSAGEMMESEFPMPTAKMPAAAIAALAKEYPKATFGNHQSVTKMYFEVEVVIDGKKHEVTVDAAGNIEDESKWGDEAGEKDEHANGEHAKGEHGKGDKDGEKDEDGDND